MSTEEVVLKKVPAITVASVREVIPTYEDMGKHYEEIFAFLGQHGANPAGPPLTLYHDKEHRERDIDTESAVPVAGSVPSGERVKVRELPAVEQMASTVHEGSYDGLSEAYGRLTGWRSRPTATASWGPTARSTSRDQAPSTSRPTTSRSYSSPWRRCS